MTINELLRDAIRYDGELLAYAVYWSIKNGLCKGTDSASLFDRNKVDIKEVLAMKERNELALNVIKLFSMPIDEGKHLIVLAANEADAKGQFLKELNRLPNKVFDITNRMHISFWFEETKQYKSIRDIREEILVFPHTVMVFEKQ